MGRSRGCGGQTKGAGRIVGHAWAVDGAMCAGSTSKCLRVEPRVDAAGAQAHLKGQLEDSLRVNWGSGSSQTPAEFEL